MLLSKARQQGSDKADADAPAQIAHQRGEAADLVVLLLGNAGVTQRIDGDEEERQAERNRENLR